MKLVVIRHGESEWNALNKFTGWHDADLSERGVEEARRSGTLLKEKGFEFDVVFTSVLKRAVKTLYYVQDELDAHHVPVERSWRLNERMYGGLQGLNKAETAEKHGEEQVHVWRRSYDVPPPQMAADDPHHPRNDKKYQHLDASCLPSSECLKDCVERVLPFWHDSIVPALKANKRVLIVAHGNSLRSLVKYLDDVSDDEIAGLNIPTGIPLVYELDDTTLRPVKKGGDYLADEEQLKKQLAEVAAQGKAQSK